MDLRESIHLASTHTAFDPRIFHKECRSLARAGHRVTFIVPHEQDEVVDGVRIQAVPKPKDGRERLFKTLGHVYRAALAASPDAVYHFHDAELILHMLLLKLRGRTVVYDAHEYTPRQILHQHWIPKPLRRPLSLAMRWFEWLGGHLFDGVIAAVPEILDHFPKGRRAVVHNFPILDEMTAAAPTPYAARPLRVVYVGALTAARGAREMVAAMRGLPPSLPAELVLGGTFYPASLEEELRRAPGAERTRFAGYLRRAQVAEVLAQARVGLVTLHPTPQYVESYPTKLFEYMAAGVPVIASDFPRWRRFVEEAGCGLLVDPMDPAAIAGAVRWMLERPDEAAAMGARGREAVRLRYSWEQEARKLLAFYEDLETRPPGAGQGA